MTYNRFLLIIIGGINSLTCTKLIYRSLVITLASEVVLLKMPSRNQRKRSKQRAEYLQKQDEKKANARALCKANPEKKKASVHDSTRLILVSYPDPDSQQLRMDYITATLYVLFCSVDPRVLRNLCVVT